MSCIHTHSFWAGIVSTCTYCGATNSRLLARDARGSGDALAELKALAAAHPVKADDFPWLHRSGIIRARIVGETAEEVDFQLMNDCGPGRTPPTRTMVKPEFQEKFGLSFPSDNQRRQPDPASDGKLPLQDDIEKILLRRLSAKRLEGYTLETAHEIAAALRDRDAAMRRREAAEAEGQQPGPERSEVIAQLPEDTAKQERTRKPFACQLCDRKDLHGHTAADLPTAKQERG